MPAENVKEDLLFLVLVAAFPAVFVESAALDLLLLSDDLALPLVHINPLLFKINRLCAVVVWILDYNGLQDENVI